MSILSHYSKEEHNFVKKVISDRQAVILNDKTIITSFLTPREQDIIKSVYGKDDSIKYMFYGGYEQAERKVCVITPPFFNVDNESSKIVCLSGKFNNKFSKIEHRNVLGTLMSLGVSREKFGDIIINDNTLHIFVTNEIVRFIINNVNMIGKTKIVLTKLEDYDIINKRIDVSKHKVVVSSLRIDNVISKIYNISRQNVKEYFMLGYVKLNHKVEKDFSKKINAGDLISLRNYGRSKVIGIKNITRKGNLVIEVEM